MSIFDPIIEAVSGVSPVDMNNASIGLDAFGRSFTAGTQIRHGLDMQAAAQYQAAQLRQMANTEAAQGERSAEWEGIKTQELMSHQLARAASGGGGASDPTIVNIMARTASEGAYRQASALYSGQDAARLRTMQADAEEYQGKAAKDSAFINAAGGILDSGTSILRGAAMSSMLAKYGGRGPANDWSI